MVVGGYAVAHHGFVRYTGDIDVWIAIDPANAAKMMECMLECCGPATDLGRAGCRPVCVAGSFLEGLSCQASTERAVWRRG